MQENNNEFKVGFAGIVGKPNVGKSTLLNNITGEKISITSDKPQTTRKNIRGIYNDFDSQIVFVDTPGIQSPKNKLGTYMLNEANSIIKDIDILIFVVDGTFNPRISDTDNFFDKLNKLKTPKILVINKMDKISNEDVLKLIKSYSEFDIFEEIVPMNALKGINTLELMQTIKKYLPRGQKLYPDDMVSDQSTKELISEIIREKLLRYLDKEVPHGIAVEIEKIDDDKKKNIIKISSVIYCEKDSHKKIIIGKDGKKLKGIGKSARKELEEIFGCKVFLSTWVKVKENWRNNNFIIKDLGYNTEK